MPSKVTDGSLLIEKPDTIDGPRIHLFHCIYCSSPEKSYKLEDAFCFRRSINLMKTLVLVERKVSYYLMRRNLL